MAPTRKQFSHQDTVDLPDLDDLLTSIENERVPDRLLALAQELQHALSTRRLPADVRALRPEPI
ncbi:hypothetical protein [Mesorhizobium sp. CAU 1741]|uniref:hypothetical protein n=1 Tax=Mesorhizobium sp. CAU 1741 TaxID=3140366 RepID=UPI00325B540C